MLEMPELKKSRCQQLSLSLFGSYHMMDVFSASAAEPARLGFLTKQFALVSCHVAFVFFEGFPQVIGSDIFKGIFYFPVLLGALVQSCSG